MNFVHHVEVDLPVDEAVDEMKRALAARGFGVLTEIDVSRTMSDKLGIETPPQVILGACNPELANRALTIDPRIAALLPCNVVVRDHHGHTVVDALDPAVLASLTENPALEPIAEEAAAGVLGAVHDVLGC